MTSAAAICRLAAVSKVRNRPAESAGVAASVAVLIVTVLGVSDPRVYGALVVVVGFVPAAVTFLVEQARERKAAGE